jgi:ribosomal protein L35AE/L33A
MGYKTSRKYLKISDDQIKQLIDVKKTSCKQCVVTKKVEYKIEYKTNTALAKREVRRRHGASSDKYVTNLDTRHIGLNLKCTNFKTNK